MNLSYFMDIATVASQASKDPSSKVGAVIADQYGRIVSTGFNGFPRGVKDEYTDREEKLRRTIHAEENAILFARRDLSGCKIYTTHPPCAHCTAVIIQSGITEITYFSANDAFTERWLDNLSSSQSMLKEAGFTCEDLGNRYIRWAT